MMRKNQPPPVFPGLGVPDDRRETPVVSGAALELKRQLATRNFYHPRSDNWRKKVDDSYAGQDTSSLRYHNGVRQYHSVSYASAEDLSGTAGGGSSCATKHHEDTHRLFDRVEEAHGRKARDALATHLLAQLPAEDLKTLRAFVARSYEGPADDEEHVAELVSYHNRGPSKVSLDRGMDAGMKSALKVVRQAAREVRPEHLKKTVRTYYRNAMDREPHVRDLCGSGGAGTCGIKAVSLWKRLRAAGHQVQVVVGTFEGEPHAWVETTHHVLDPTFGQFAQPADHSTLILEKRKTTAYRAEKKGFAAIRHIESEWPVEQRASSHMKPGLALKKSVAGWLIDCFDLTAS